MFLLSSIAIESVSRFRDVCFSLLISSSLPLEAQVFYRLLKGDVGLIIAGVQVPSDWGEMDFAQGWGKYASKVSLPLNFPPYLQRGGKHHIYARYFLKASSPTLILSNWKGRGGPRISVGLWLYRMTFARIRFNNGTRRIPCRSRGEKLKHEKGKCNEEIYIGKSLANMRCKCQINATRKVAFYVCTYKSYSYYVVSSTNRIRRRRLRSLWTQSIVRSVQRIQR